VSHVPEHPRPALTADMLVVAGDPGGERSVLMIRRGGDPFRGLLALPGGFVDVGETVEQAALRELEEETGVVVEAPDLRLAGVYSQPGRDPRGWTVSVLFRVDAGERPEARHGDDAAAVEWVSVADALGNPTWFAFDHDRMLRDQLGGGA
jgi:8-oxo-dGTP diphosphatase